MRDRGLRDEDLLYPIEVLADAAGVDRQRAKQWAEGPLGGEYALRSRTSAHREVRMLDRAAALEFMLIAALRSEHEVPFPRVHRFLDAVEDVLDHVDLLDLKVEPETRHLFWRVGTAPWEGTDSPKQYRLASMINLVPLVQERLDRIGSRSRDDWGQVESTRGVHRSRACFAGTRVRVATVQEWLAAGVDRAEILRQYPVLVQEDLDTAEAMLATA